MKQFWATLITGALPYIIGGAALIFGGFYVYTYLQSNFGAGTPDPGGGAPATGILSGVANATLEIGKSSESYSDAAVQTVSNPLQTIDTIAGGNQGPTPYITGNNPNDPTGVARVANNAQSLAEQASPYVGFWSGLGF